MPTGRQVAFDATLTNVAVEAFNSIGETLGVNALFPTVAVGKEGGRYHTIDKSSWLLNYETSRGRLVAPREIQWNVSTDNYFCDNHSLRELNAKEDLMGADSGLAVRERSIRNVNEALLRAKNVRVASIVTSISNVGCGNQLAGADLWTATLSAHIISHVATARAYFYSNGLPMPNTLVISRSSYELARMNDRLLAYFKYQKADARVSDSDLKTVFGVQNMIIEDTVYNSAQEGATASYTNAWGNNAVFAYVDPKPMGPKTKTFGLTFSWDGLGTGASIYARRYDHADEGVHGEYVEAGYYHDEKIVASALAYTLRTHT